MFTMVNQEMKFENKNVTVKIFYFQHNFDKDVFYL